MDIHKQKTILIVEDQPELAEMVSYLMMQEGYQTSIAASGEDALKYIKKSPPDLVILDIMLPKIDGFQVCNQMRRFASMPILILSAKIDGEDIIRGLEIGADDYVTKPFNNRELVLRVNNMINRIVNTQSTNTTLTIGELTIDFISKQAKANDTIIFLTPIEYKLLSYMAVYEGHVLSWERLLKEVWGHDDWDGGRKLVKVNIGRLRKKLDKACDSGTYIETSWGMGYKLVNPLAGK